MPAGSLSVEQTRTNGSFTGGVKTLIINAKTTIKPAGKSNDRAPDYRILNGSSVEFGAAHVAAGTPW